MKYICMFLIFNLAFAHQMIPFMLYPNNFDSVNEYNDKPELSSNDNSFRSISKGKININSENLDQILHRELNDVSADLSNKVQQAIGKVSRETPSNFKEVIIIKKRIMSDGKRKVVNLNVREKMIPKEGTMKEFGTRAIFGGILFLFAGLIFTKSIKMYQTYVRRKYIRLGEKCDIKG